MRHLIVFAAILALLAGVFYWAQGRTACLEGRVIVRDLDGREAPGSAAKLAWYPADVVEQQLRSWLADYDEWHRANGLEIRAARNEWNRRVGLRDEAAGILRVAERANSADLAICRARHREATADAEEAFRRMEELGSSADQTTDPARFFDALPAPSVEYAADADGYFRADAPQGVRGYIVAVIERGGERKETLLWLRAVAAGDETLQLSNNDVLTSDSLAKIARELKKPGSPEGSPSG